MNELRNEHTRHGEKRLTVYFQYANILLCRNGQNETTTVFTLFYPLCICIRNSLELTEMPCACERKTSS